MPGFESQSESAADRSLARGWLDAVADTEIARELEAIYSEVATEITMRGPSCWASGRCCNFAKTRHLLYVTGLEAAYTVASRRTAERATLEANQVQQRSSTIPVVGVTLTQVAAARERGDCPYLEGNMCGAHTIKPLGCRVYFCDQNAQEWQQELSERALLRIRAMHDAHRIEYRYGEWRSMLETVLSCEG